MATSYRVRAEHSSLDLRSLFMPSGTFSPEHGSEFRIQQDRHSGTFYASARLLGCGKDYATAEEAIMGLLASHGFCQIVVVALDGERHAGPVHFTR